MKGFLSQVASLKNHRYVIHPSVENALQVATRFQPPGYFCATFRALIQDSNADQETSASYVECTTPVFLQVQETGQE